MTDDVIHKQFLYYEPAERLVDDLLDEVCGVIAERRIRLFVIDAFNPMLSLHGLDPGSTPDIETFWREVATPITAAGAAPTLLDHVTKNADARGKYAYGSERKASGAIVHVGFRLLEPFARGGTGRSLLATHKDRPGYLPRPTIGRLVLVSDGEAVSYSLEADHSREGDTFRPTVLMERVSRKLEGEVEPVSQRWIEEQVSGKGSAIRTAVDVLATEAYLAKEKVGRGFGFTSVRPYREADDEPFEEVETTASPPRPHRVPNLGSTRSPDCVLSVPYGDEGRTGVDMDEQLRPDGVPTLIAVVGEVAAPDLPADAPEWEKAYWARRTEGEVA